MNTLWAIATISMLHIGCQNTPNQQRPGRYKIGGWRASFLAHPFYRAGVEPSGSVPNCFRHTERNRDCASAVANWTRTVPD